MKKVIDRGKRSKTLSEVYLPKPVSTDLTKNPDSVLTNPIEKDGVRTWSI